MKAESVHTLAYFRRQRDCAETTTIEYLYISDMEAMPNQHGLPKQHAHGPAPTDHSYQAPYGSQEPQIPLIYQPMMSSYSHAASDALYNPDPMIGPHSLYPPNTIGYAQPQTQGNNQTESELQQFQFNNMTSTATSLANCYHHPTQAKYSRGSGVGANFSLYDPEAHTQMQPHTLKAHVSEMYNKNMVVTVVEQPQDDTSDESDMSHSQNSANEDEMTDSDSRSTISAPETKMGELDTASGHHGDQPGHQVEPKDGRRRKHRKDHGSRAGRKSRRREPTVQQRVAANVRERRRMNCLNESFDILRSNIPTFAYEKHLSRIETLRLAMNYIAFMNYTLQQPAQEMHQKYGNATREMIDRWAADV